MLDKLFIICYNSLRKELSNPGMELKGKRDERVYLRVFDPDTVSLLRFTTGSEGKKVLAFLIPICYNT